MFYSSEASQTFYTVIPLPFAVVACPPSRPSSKHVSPSPCTSNSCHNLLPVLVEILRAPAKPTALMLSLPNSALLPKTLHAILQQEVLCSLPPSCPLPLPQPAALQCAFLDLTVCAKTLAVRRKMKPLIAISSPSPPAQPAVADALVGIRDSSKERHTKNISTSGEPSIRVCNQFQDAFP